MSDSGHRDYEEGVADSPATVIRRVPVGNVANGKWHHVALVVDRNRRKAGFYLDGTLVGGEVADFTLASEVSAKPGFRTLNLGDGWGGNNSSAWQDLSIDEIRITRRALAPAEFITRTPRRTGLAVFLK